MEVTRRHLLTLAAATGAAAAFTPTAATAAVPGRGGVLRASAPSLHPEGVAWDATRGAFLVSSLRHGTVSVVRWDGSVRTLISHPEMVSTLGVRVDVARRRVLVAYADIGVGARSSPQTMFVSSGLGVFDLATGAPIRLVPLTAVPGGHVANDIAVDPAGNAYVTDAASTGVYRVDPAGDATVLVDDPRFANPTAGLNGIAWHPAGHLLAVGYTTGELWRIGLAGEQPRLVELDQPLVGGDGLALLPGGRLVAVTNDTLVPGQDAVQTLRSRDGWASARTVHRSTPWPDGGGSTVTVTPAGPWVVAGALDALFLQGVTVDEFTIRRYPW